MDWSFWDVLWTTFVVFIWIAVLVIFFHVVIDIFRSRDLSGWGKTGWLILVLVLPFIGMLAYIITRGDGMAMRGAQDQIERGEAMKAAIGANSPDPVERIASAQRLLESGAIDQAEFETLKKQALAG